MITLWNAVLVLYLVCGLFVYGHLIWMHRQTKKRHQSELPELTPVQVEGIMDAIQLLEYESEFS